MPAIVFKHSDGRAETVEARSGDSIMLAATRHGIAEIAGDCGGNAICATCHVYVDDRWASRLPVMGDDEDGLLEGVIAPRQPNSRLSCQIRMAPELDGIVVRLPAQQN
ncbi:MAG: 2Fe-2S iron-sulfur cluster-binding protein [Phreatobacter sp.]|mgnify:CR=1 FL=1